MTLSVGMKVRTKFHSHESSIIRTLTDLCLVYTREFGSGAWASTDGGEPCPTCGHRGTPITRVDSAWFVPVEEP